ncbi:MFS transporter [Kordia sp.]|uniref:POT-type proton-dependent oligopeptide transporter n=1 Tax=Kordia sp. TaxID=1965332 RepID=UPI003B5B34CE
MEHSVQQTRTSNTIIILFLLFLDKMCYYGIRSMIILYLISDVFQVSDFHAISVYKYLTYFFILTQIIGGIFGDFVVDNKKAIFIGSLLAVLGCVNACIPNLRLFYIGLVLVIIGSGFLKTNMLAAFGKNFYNHQKYLDTAFSFYYLVVNIGALAASILFPIISNKYGFIVGFGTIGIAYISIALISLALNLGKEKLVYDTQKVSENAIVYVIIAIFLSAFFWGIYELAGTRTGIILSNENLINGMNTIFPMERIHELNFFILVPMLILGGILWLKFHRLQFLKIGFGFLFATLAILQLTYISFENIESNVFHIMSSICFFALAEIFVGPIIMSTITRYTNPKYLTIIMAVYGGASLSIVYAFSPINEFINDKSEFFTYIALILAAAIAILLFLAVFLREKYLKKSIVKQ